MAKRGRKPARAGTTRVPGAAGRWRKPAHLKGPAETAWRNLVAMLRARGTLDHTDPILVEVYATNVELLRKAQAELARDGPIVDSGLTFKAHPAVAVVNSATMRLKAICHDLGLTPGSSRFSAETTSGPPKQDKWDGLLGIVG